MLKATTTILFFFFLSLTGFTQCLSALSPPACTGTEPSLADNETLNTGTTKWYYGAATTYNSLTLKGGTLVVCSNLTIDKFYIDSGTIFVRPGARFVIGSGIGSGVQFQGNCAIYNYGTCEVQRNLTLENNASAGRPNIVYNALSSSVFKMPNQYLVIGNPYSWFVNKGSAEFWGIITDNQSSPGAVCLGDRSSTRMAILINKVLNSYIAPEGNACVNVYQFSQFYNALTASPTLSVCLGSGHSSDASCIPFGCQPNNWGAAQLFTSCINCGALTALQVQFVYFNAAAEANGSAKLEWQVSGVVQGGVFKILRSADGINYTVLDSIITSKSSSTTSTFSDRAPQRGNNFYMISYFNPASGTTTNSKTTMLFTDINPGFTLYPVPFDNKFYIDYTPDAIPQKILLTDVNGRNIKTRHTIKQAMHRVEVLVLDKLASGIYIIHLLTNKSVIAKTIMKQ